MVSLLRYTALVVTLVFTLSFFGGEVLAQDGPKALIEGKIASSSGKKLGGATITVKKNGSVFQTVTSTSSGKYPAIELPMGAQYTIVVELDGYVGKEIAVDAKTGYFEEDSPEVIPLDIPFELDERKPDVDYSSISNGFQIGKLSIDAATGGLAVDSKYTSQQSSKYKKFFEELEKQSNQEEEQFQKLVADGDKAFQSGNYDQALGNYEKALEIKANDPAVTGKVTETQKKIEQKKQFDQLVADGDGSLNSKNFDQAIAKYQQAKTLMPDDKTIDGKIKAAQDAKAAAAGAELDAQYAAKIKEAQQAFADKDYGYAKSLYQEAGKIKPNEKEPPTKIAEIDKIIKDQMEQEQQFSTLVAAGDKAMLGEEYDTAIDKYTEALKIKSDDRVKSELQKAIDLKKKKADADAAAAKKAEFDQLIAAGDGKLGSEDFDGAVSEYQKALATGVDNATANAKIKEAQDKKKAKEDAAAAAAKKAEFDQLIAAGDGKLGSEDFDGAVSEYQKALATGVDNATANAKIKEAQDKKKAKEDANAAAAKKAEYDQLIASGDGKLGSEDFDGAVSEYQKALATGVDNATANAKIKEAQDKKKAKEDANAAAAKKAEYDQLIASGDGKLGSEDFDGAVSEYQKALATGVDNATANAKIKEAQDKKKAKQDADAAAAKQAEFDQLISSGDGKLSSDDFAGAIANYEKALATGVNNTLANQKITEAKNAKKAYEDDLAAQDAAAKQAQFDEFISAGNDNLGKQSFDAAIGSYEKALATGVDNATANTKIKAAQDAKAAYEKELAAKNEAEALKQKFDQLISSGDNLLASQSFDGAIADYQKALATGVDNATANTKIKAAQDAKAAYEKDLAAKGEAEALKQKFDQFIKDGDGQLAGQSFDGAIADYQKALATGVDNATANTKIKAAQDAKAAYEKNQAAQDAAAKKAEFDQFIKDGDGQLAGQSFDGAIADYQKALATGVDNATANTKIKAAQDAKAAYEKNQAANAAAAAADAKFNELIAKGDAAKSSKEWVKAKDFYAQAKEAKQESPVPQQKIDEVNKLMEQETLADQQAQLQKYLEKGQEITDAGEYDKAIGLYEKAKGLFPAESVLDERIQKVKALKADEDKYNQFMASADSKFEAGNWKEAKTDYIKAKGVFDRPRPNEQIALIDKKIAEQDAANNADAELAQKKADYDALMKKAKSQKDAKSYQEAIASYTAAKKILPSESEPQQRIDEINDLLAKQNAQKDLIEKYNAAIAKADAKRDEAIAAKKDELAIEAKKLYGDANKIKSDESYPQEQVTRLSGLMEEWAKGAADEQYQKIIDKADELFTEKNWDGAEKLYKRAESLKPIDPYPPAQLEKIKKARESEGKLDSYNLYVQEGNSLLDEKKYKKAIEAYQNALGVKPTASYPQQKIDEINELMRQQANKAKEEREKETAVEIDLTYYGDEVTGKSEEDIDNMFKKQREADLEENDNSYDKVKADDLAFTESEMSFQKNRNETNNENYEEMKLDRSELEGSWDDQRKDVLPEMVELKETELNKVGGFYEQEESRSYGVDQYNNTSELQRSKVEEKRDDRRVDNIVDMHDYKEDQLEKHHSMTNNEIDVITENQNYYTQRDEQFANDELKRDDRRVDNIIDMEKYKEDQLSISENNTSYEVDITETNQNYYDAREEKYAQDELKRDDRRVDNIVDMHDYKEDQSSINTKWVDQGVTNNYETHQDYKQMASEFEQFADDADFRRREETVKQVDDYKFEQENILKSDKEMSVEVTDLTNEYNTNMKEEIADFANEMDIPRENNVDATNVYKEDLLKDQNDVVEGFTESTLNNYNDKEKAKEKQYNLLVDEDEMREENIDKMEEYKESKLTSDAQKSDAFTGVGYDKSLSYDSIKSQKATMFSDENVDALAKQYSEGVTEKMFQRTNNLGEVVEVTIVRIVVNGNKADEYKKITTKWTTNYFKNGGIITQHIWDTETN